MVKGVGPLSGVKVLDFTIYMNGPSATGKMADAGAEVLMVEPLNGTPSRKGLSMQTKDGYPFLHQHVNRGKRSLTLDMKHPSALQVLEPLVKWADVITNNFRPGVLDKLGLSYERCKAWNPRIIYTANTGWGPKGELAGRPSFDNIAQGHAGVLVEQGGGPTQGEPAGVGFGFSDEVGAMNYYASICAALFARERTGKGQRLDTSLLGATINFQHLDLGPVLHDAPLHTQRDNGGPPMAPGVPTSDWPPSMIEIWYLPRCSDGRYFVMMPGTMAQWRRLCVDVFGREDLYELTSTDARRIEHKLRVRPEILKECAKRPAAEWIELLIKADVPVGPVNTYRDLAQDPHVWENGYIKEAEIPGFGKNLVVGYPTLYSDTPLAEVIEPAPELGAHTGAYLKQVGFSEESIARFASEGVTAKPRTSKL